MADRVTLDFETGEIIWDTDRQKGTEIDFNLKDRKAAILAAMGYEMVDMKPILDTLNAFANGKLSMEELEKRMDELSE